MNKTMLLIAVLIGLVIVAVGGVWVYNRVLGETESASAPISAAPLVVNTQASAGSAPEAQPALSGGSAGAGASTTDVPAVTVEAQADAATQAPLEEAPAIAVTGGLKIFRIVPDESEVRFTIYEELNGAPKNVIGVSNQVAGEVGVDFTDLSAARVGEIKINARTFVTDNERRNQAIRNIILNTDQYEFITFTPTAISGLSGEAVPQKPFTFQVTGDLTVRNVTKPVAFEVTVQGESEMRMTGSASATIRRSDFNIIVPDLPFLANVADEVKLEIDFVLVL